MLRFSEPTIIERTPYKVVGAYSTYEGETPEDEGPGWQGAEKGFFSRSSEITNRVDDGVLGFLYRPHNDHPEISLKVKACFIGAEVTHLNQVPTGMATTQFSGGKYVMVDCIGDTGDEAAEGVGKAIGMLMTEWIPAHSYIEGDACFAFSHEKAQRPPHIETVYIKIEPTQRA